MLKDLLKQIKITNSNLCELMELMEKLNYNIKYLEERERENIEIYEKKVKEFNKKGATNGQ